MTKNEIAPVTLPEFVLEVGLYDPRPLLSCKEFQTLFGHNTVGRFDAHCTECGGETTFVVNEGVYIEGVMLEENFLKQHGFRTVTFKCSRNLQHSIRIQCHLLDGEVQKIGQFPSIASLKFSTMKSELNNLDPKDRREFATGVGLLSHGVGIGSYVYFRRILERQVQGVFDQHKEEEGWDDEQFLKERMGERVKQVEKYLPEFFTEHPVLYAVLSKGIHELDEETCLAHAPVLQAALEIILEEVEAKRLKQKRRAEASAAVKKLKL